MSRYAEHTQVGSDRSRQEIEKTLRRYGATGFAYGWDANAAVIGFVADGRQVRFVLPLPDRQSRDFTLTETGRRRTDSAAEAAYEQAVRQRWRALALVIKAKLEAVTAGIVTFEDEFMAHVVLPGGGTVGQLVGPRIEEAYASGEVPMMLPAYATAGRRELTA